MVDAGRLPVYLLAEAASVLGYDRPWLVAARVAGKLRAGGRGLTGEERRVAVAAVELAAPATWRLDLQKRGRWPRDVPGVDTPDALPLAEEVSRELDRRLRRRRTKTLVPTAVGKSVARPAATAPRLHVYNVDVVAQALENLLAQVAAAGGPGEWARRCPSCVERLRSRLEEAEALAQLLSEAGTPSAREKAQRLTQLSTVARQVLAALGEAAGEDVAEAIREAEHIITYEAAPLLAAARVLAAAREAPRERIERHLAAITRLKQRLQQLHQLLSQARHIPAAAQAASRAAETIKQLEEAQASLRAALETPQPQTRRHRTRLAPAAPRHPRIPATARRLADYIWQNLPEKTRAKWRYIQILNIARLIEKQAREHGIDPWAIDWLHELDWSLAYHELKNELKNMIENKLGKTMGITEEDIKRIQEEMEKMQEEEIPWWLREEEEIREEPFPA